MNIDIFTLLEDNTPPVSSFNDVDEVEEELPVREKVEVVVTKGDKICVCKKESGYWTFPGGGVEGNDSHEETAYKECLEEVGFRVKNIRSLNVRNSFPPIFDKSHRNSQYSSIDVHYYTAEFDRIDKSVLGADDDAMTYMFVEKGKAKALVGENKLAGFGLWRKKAIDAL